MNLLTSISGQLSQVIRAQSLTRRLTLLIVIVGSVCGFLFLMTHARTGGYVDLYKGVQMTDAREALAKLAQLGIDARLRDGFSTIQVPRNKVDEAAVMLAMEGIPGSGSVGWEQLDRNSFGQSKMQQEKSFHRMQEGELERTLLAIRSIERARVHLGIPEASLFLDEEQQATASVMIKVRSGERLSDKQVQGIIHLVSHAVEGLTSDNVQIIDDSGNLLVSTQGADSNMASLAQQSYKTNYEEQVNSRIETMLEKVVGKGRVEARVQADFDFSQLHRISEVFNPDDQDPIVREQSTQIEGMKSVPDGSTGTGAVPTPAAGGAGGRSDTLVSYEVSKMWSEEKQTEPTLTGVSVAVLIGGKREETTDSEGNITVESVAPSTEELSTYEELVKSMIGFKTGRDKVTVSYVPFLPEAIEPLGEAPRFSYETRRMIELGIQWGIVGLIGLLLILVVLRPAVKQILVSPMSGGMVALPAGGGGMDLSGMDENTMELMANLAEAEASGDANAIAMARAAGGEQASTAGAQQNLARKKGLKSSVAKQMLDVDEDMAMDPETVKAMRQQKMAALKAKQTNEQSALIQRDVLTTAKSDPNKTVSLLRQWMDEA